MSASQQIPPLAQPNWEFRTSVGCLFSCPTPVSGDQLRRSWQFTDEAIDLIQRVVSRARTAPLLGNSQPLNKRGSTMFPSRTPMDCRRASKQPSMRHASNVKAHSRTRLSAKPRLVDAIDSHACSSANTLRSSWRAAPHSFRIDSMARTR